MHNEHIIEWCLHQSRFYALASTYRTFSTDVKAFTGIGGTWHRQPALQHANHLAVFYGDRALRAIEQTLVVALA